MLLPIQIYCNFTGTVLWYYYKVELELKRVLLHSPWQ